MADKGQLLLELQQRMETVKPLPDEEGFFTCNTTLMRYLKARDWNIDEAEKYLKETVEWRRTTRPMQLQCTWCHERPGYHSMRQIGHDEMGRPVVYSSFAQAAIHHNCVEDSVAHTCFLMENAKVTMGPGVHTWVFIVDCTGMSLPACNPRLGYGVTQVLSNHYPERLGLVICLNHSPVFQGVFKAIKVFLHPQTTAKVQLVRSKKKMKALFDKLFSEELKQWLYEELSLNKQRPLPVSQREFWHKPEDPFAHDPRGTPSYVAEYVDTFLGSSQTTSDPTKVYKPHPNIVDALKGTLKGVVPSTPEECRGGATGSSVLELEDLSDDDLPELDISDEYQIPVDAKKLC